MIVGKSGSKLNSFKDLKQIGQGGFGIVYSARRDNGEKVAIKKIGKAAAQSRIREEIKTMKQLDHRNIVKLYETFVDNGDTYLVMELCEGGSLRSYIKENGPLDDTTAVHILRQLISAVTYIHREDKLHRDISDGNVFLIDATKKKMTVKLGDFGLAKSIGRGETACTIVGTPGYIANEVYRQNYDKTADVYSLGAVLYTMLTGKHPPSQGVPNTAGMDERAAALINHMMHPDSRRRILLKEIVMTEYMKENTDEETRLFSREHSRDSRRPRSREPIRSGSTFSQDRRPLARSISQPSYSGRDSNRLEYDRVPSTSNAIPSAQHERGRQRSKNCGQGLGPSHDRPSQTWPIRMERLAGQRIRTDGGRYIVETDTRCRFEAASQGGVVRRILIVEYDMCRTSQTVSVHRINERTVKCREERDELIELTSHPYVYTSEFHLPNDIHKDYIRLHNMVVSTIAGRVAKFTFRRPPQFPDAHAQLMENGDLRIKFPRDIIVRKKDNGSVYSISGQGNRKEEVRGLTLQKVSEVYSYLIRLEDSLTKGMGGMLILPMAFSAGPDLNCNPNNSPFSAGLSQNSRFPFSNVLSNQQSLVPHSAPLAPRSRQPSSSNVPRRVSTDENVPPNPSEPKYKMKIDPSTQKVRSIQAGDGRVLRCSTATPDLYIFTDPSIRSEEQRFKGNGRVPERASEMLSKLLERIRKQEKT